MRGENQQEKVGGRVKRSRVDITKQKVNKF